MYRPCCTVLSVDLELVLQLAVQVVLEEWQHYIDTHRVIAN